MPINYFETSFEARERRAQIENLYHGEAVDLVAVVTTDGVPKSLDGYTATGVFQPTSMHGSDDFYELSADIVDNHIIVHWTPGSDFGEDSYMVWVLVSKEGDAAYPITWRLDMAYSPNFPLSALDPIPKTIDFSKYELLNAPWLELSAADDLPYLPLSGGTVTGEFAVENFIQSDATNITLGKNNDLTKTSNTVVVGNGNSVEGSEMVRSTAVVVGTDNLARGLARKQILVGASLSANTSAPAIGIGYYGTIGQDSVAVGEGPNFTKMQVGMEAVAIGIGISSVADGSIAIGHGANTGNVRTVQLGEGMPTAAYQFNVFDKNVLSGSGFILNRDRIPYLSEYETKADATAEHQAIVDGLSAYAKKEDIPEVPTDLSAFTNSPGYLTAHQSLSDYYTKEEADGKFLTAHQDLTDYATKEYVQSEISDFITEDALTGLATKEEVQAVDDKLSDYAEKEELTAYAQLSDIPDIPTDEYLPLSGGTVTGRIYYGDPSGVFTHHQEFYVSEVSATFFQDVTISAERSFLDGTYSYNFDDCTRSGNIRMRIRIDGDPQIYDFGGADITVYANLDDETEQFLGTFSITINAGSQDQNGYDGRYPNEFDPTIATYVPSDGAHGSGILPVDTPPWMDLWVLDEDESEYVNIGTTEFQPFWNSAAPLTYLTEEQNEDPFVLSSELPVLPDDLVHEDELSDYAQLSDIPELPEDIVRKDDLSVYAQLSDLENIDIPEISACLSSDEFADVEELGAAETVSFQDLVDKVNLVIQKLKRTWRDPKYTWVTYNDNSVSSFNIVGSINGNTIPNKSNAINVEVGTSVTGLGKDAFANCLSLSSISLPHGIISIGESSFYHCPLTAIYFPNTITTFGRTVFYECSNLQTVVFEDGITTIGNNAIFYKCTSLTSVNIPSSVTSIPIGAFQDSGLSELIIPSSITNIGLLAFSNCIITATVQGKTIVEVQGMNNYPWGAKSGSVFHCTDGDITL